MKRVIETVLERDVLPDTIPELPTVRRMTLGMSSPMKVPSPKAREAVEGQQKVLIQGWDPLFIGY